MIGFGSAAIAGDKYMPGRLSDSVVPENYNLKLTIDPQQDTFQGQVLIAAELIRESKEITLHAQDLTIQDVLINDTKIDPKNIATNKEQQTITLLLPTALPAGPVKIEITYRGKYGEKMEGLYKSYSTYKGKKETYLFTQFEPTYARQMLPSFDEPNFKATFQLTVTAPKDLTLISNMPALKRTVAGNLQTTIFDKTPKMSTYLLALGAARLQSKSRTVEGTQVTVWTRPEEIHQADFALDVAEKSLTYLNKYFGLPYQLPKMDLVAVPDFAAGAMENWGAIFFRDSAILIDPTLSSTRAKRRVAEVVAHEIVHQWFGNLVTMEWWNDLWLNEAFATWVAYKVVDDWQPKWDVWLEFEQGKQMALRVDALKNTRPISSNVVSAGEIEAQFDPLSYEKGGAVLRMIENYLGADAFRKGIQKYMQKYQYKNTIAANLWNELEQASGQPVMKIAQDWLSIPGYPMIEIHANNNVLELKQRRFLADGSKADHSVWTIPLVIRYQLQGEKEPRIFRTILKEKQTKIQLPGENKLLWVYPNQWAIGVYRVQLDPVLLSSMTQTIQALSPAERIALLDDLWVQVKNSERPVQDLLEMLVIFKQDDTRIILESVTAYLDTLSERLLKKEDRELFGQYTRELLEPHWARLGWPKTSSTESDDTKLSRAAVLSTLGMFSPKLMDEAKSYLASYLQKPTTIEPTLVQPLLNLGARRGQEKEFEQYLAQLKGARTPEQRDQFLGALARFEQLECAQRLLALTLTNDIRGQDVWRPFAILLANSNPAVQAATWDFIKANWKALQEKAGARGAVRIMEGTASLWSLKWKEEVRAFFTTPENYVNSQDRSLAQTLESIDLGIKFKEAQAERLSAWLKKH